MPAFTLHDLAALATNLAAPNPAAIAAPRLISIWEISQWILPMAPEHLRRVLAAEPDLPQGHAGVEGGTRWFTPAEVATLRAHFAKGARKTRYAPQRPANAQAPLISLTAPQGHAGRSTAALHLATAAALAGYKVLLIDADPAGSLALALGVTDRPEPGVLGLIARAAARHLRQANEARLDRGEAPLPMDAVQSAALGMHARDLIRPTQWPGLDLLPAGAGLMQADLQIGRWRMAQARWQPWRAVADAITSDGLRHQYDLILCDTGRGLGPLALAMLASADVLLAPLPLIPTALHDLGAGLQALAQGLSAVQAEAQITAQALGQALPALHWRKLAVLPTRASPDTAALLARYAAALPNSLLPNTLPEIPQIAMGQAAQFYDLDYRATGKLIYTPQRDATEAAWRGVAGLLSGLWAEDATPQNQLPLG